LGAESQLAEQASGLMLVLFPSFHQTAPLHVAQHEAVALALTAPRAERFHVQRREH
jgi:hypothetical protein